MCIGKPDEGDITLPHLAYIKNRFDGVEPESFGPNRAQKINPASFVAWYLAT